MTDKRSESQFKPIKPIDMGDSVPAIRLGSVDPQNPKMADVSERPAMFIGGAASRMKALASLGKEDNESVAQIGENKPVRLYTKEGRRKAAGHLGLPNVKKKKRG